MRRVRLRRLGSRHWALIGAVILAAVLPLVVPSEASSEPTVTVTPVVRGTIGANGWYASNVTVNWTFSPLPDRTVGCDALTITADGTTQLDCQAWWGTIHIDYPLAVKVDKTPPTVRGVAYVIGCLDNPLLLRPIKKREDRPGGCNNCRNACCHKPSDFSPALTLQPLHLHCTTLPNPL